MAGVDGSALQREHAESGAQCGGVSLPGCVAGADGGAGQVGAGEASKAPAGVSGNGGDECVAGGAACGCLSQPSIKTSLFLDCSRAKQELGWEPMTSLDLGIDKTLAWWRGHVAPGLS